MHLESIVNITFLAGAYYTLIFMLTSFMMKPLAKNKSSKDKFLLYLTIGNFYIINIVFILVFFHLFNRFILILSLVASSVAVRILLDKKDAFRIYMETKETLKHLIHGEYGVKLFLYRLGNNIKQKVNGFFSRLLRHNLLEKVLFISVMSYNVYYYSYNSIRFISFGAPDEEVHLYWIQSLISGHIFPEGVYPHGFHNILSAITVLFGFHAVSVVKSFGVISMIIIMSVLYISLRRILTSKYAAMFGFVVYSLLNIFQIEATYRYQFAIPQEYAMVVLLPMALFLLEYLRYKKNMDLILFAMCFSMTISIHFYVTIIALVLCLSIALIYFYKILRNKVLLKLIISGLLAVIIALAPLAIALAMGNKMEQSMNWATSVVQGKEYGENQQISTNLNDFTESFQWNGFLDESEKDLTRFVFQDIRMFYILAALIVFSIIQNIIFIASKKRKHEHLYQLSFTIYMLFLIFLILCRALKLPTLMEPKRVAIFLAYSSPMLIAMPFETLYVFLDRKWVRKVASLLAISAIPAVIYIGMKYSLIRPLPPFYYFQTKGAMLVDCNLISKYNDYQWTIISPVNDTSVIRNNGYHYELSDFILKQENWDEDIEIKIPTKYVFLYVEKRPITLYGYRFNKDDKAVVDREMVSYEDALKPLEQGKKDNAYYKEDRKVLMSKAYFWAKEYIKYFPKEMSVYYEDSEIIVYRIIQNEYALNNLSINYGANVKK